jgi:hypothetical protein
MTIAEDILAINDLVPEPIELPEWKMSLWVRGMSGSDRDMYERRQYEQSKTGDLGVDMRAMLVSLALVDESGERVFTDQQVAQLGKKSAVALDRVVKVAARLNGMSTGSVELAAKN